MPDEKPTLTDPDALALEAGVVRTVCGSSAGLRLALDYGASVDLFDEKLLRALFTVAQTLGLKNIAISPTLVYDELASGGSVVRFKLDERDLERARSLLASTISPQAFNADWVTRLSTKATRRTLMRQLEATTKALEKAADNDLDGIINELTRRAQGLSEVRTLGKENPDPYEQFLAWNAQEQYGCACGFPYYDAAPADAGLGGLIPETMTVATAPSGEGKSTFAVSVLANLTRLSNSARLWLAAEARGDEHKDAGTTMLIQRATSFGLPIRKVMEQQAALKVIYFSTEMAAGHLSARVVQNCTNMTMTEIRNNGYGQTGAKLVRGWFEALRSVLSIFDRVTVAADMVNAVSLMRPSFPEGCPLVVIVDHAHKINGLLKKYDAGSVKGNLNVYYKDIYEMLARAAIDYHAHFLVFDQMSDARQTEYRQTNNVASLSMKDSGDTFNIADNAIVFGRSKDKKDASIGWVKKARALEDTAIYEDPFYFKATPRCARLDQITAGEYFSLSERL